VNDDAKFEVVAEHEGGVGGAEDETFTPHGFVSAGGWRGGARSGAAAGTG
jgi:hypothetical protein